MGYIDSVVYKQNMICTDFLNPYHQSIITSIIGNNPDVQIVKCGVIKDAENQKVILAPSYYEIEKEDFSNELVEIKYNQKFDTLSHKDVLGAFMSLGIKREMFGDIVIEDDCIYVACNKGMSSFLQASLTKIKRASVTIRLSNKEVMKVQEYSIHTFIVSSLRLDKVVSSFYKISRAKASEYIRSGFVKVNHKKVEEINFLCNNKDIISLKRHGRVVLQDTQRKTKSDNYVVEGYFYK
ncbi:YlmH family RNA-binding protein [Tannockella kyphosi]|uniref:YlmH family RNA-binding protein n=1 Tax=Tannockella kyphosi TaxID=2899121 RepID=UPI0020132A39|nr:YlmH/Sll1252 family protein [Tannockella kyphosi]